MRCSKSLWVTALRLLKHAVDPKSTMPILADVVLSAKGGTLTIRGTVLDREMRVNLPCEGTLGAISVPWRPLLAVSRAAKSPRATEIAVSRSGKGVRLETGGRRFDVPQGAPVKDRPVAIREPTGKTAVESFPAQRLARALEYCLPAQCMDETRFHLCALAFDEGRLVSTDGHRLHMVKNLGGFAFDGSYRQVLTRSGHALLDVIKATRASWVMARCSNSSPEVLEFSVEGSMLDVLIRERTVDSAYPPVDQVVPTHDAWCAVDARLLRESLETCIKVRKSLDAKEAGVKLVVNGELRIESDEFSETLGLEIEATSEAAVGVMPRYLLDAIRGGDQVELRYGDPLDAVLVEAGEDRVGVVMPCRIDSIDYDDRWSEK